MYKQIKKIIITDILQQRTTSTELQISDLD